MAGSEAPLEQRVYGIMQFLLAHYANRRTPESPAPRGIVAEQDALDAVLQVAAVIDEYTQSGAIPVQRGVHAGAMLMVACDYIRPLPPLSLIHISEPTRRTPISYAVFCLKKK